MNRLILLPRRTHRPALLKLLAADWALTKRRMKQRVRFIRDYLYLRQCWLSHSTAWIAAHGVINK